MTVKVRNGDLYNLTFHEVDLLCSFYDAGLYATNSMDYHMNLIANAKPSNVTVLIHSSASSESNDNSNNQRHCQNFIQPTHWTFKCRYISRYSHVAAISIPISFMTYSNSHSEIQEGNNSGGPNRIHHNSALIVKTFQDFAPTRGATNYYHNYSASNHSLVDDSKVEKNLNSAGSGHYSKFRNKEDTFYKFSLRNSFLKFPGHMSLIRLKFHQELMKLVFPMSLAPILLIMFLLRISNSQFKF